MLDMAMDPRARRITMRGGVTLEFADPRDHIAARILKRKDWYERDLLNDIARRAGAGSVVVDVGAHVGNHSVFFAAVCGARVVAFEPNPESAAQLRRNIKLNELGHRVVVHPVALGDHAGRGRIVNDAERNSGMARAVPDETGSVPVRTLDSFDLHGVAVIKIDVEGSEMAVLRGAWETIRHSRPVLYVETNDPEGVGEFLAPFGYARFGQFAITPTYGYAASIVTPRVSVAVMAHRKREAFIPTLLGALDRPAKVVWDRINDRWDTGRRALLAYDPEATHHLVIQDDAVPCRDLVAGIESVLAAIPVKTPLCLYAGRWSEFRSELHKKLVRDASFLVLDQMEWGVGIVHPVEFIEPMVAWCDRLTIPNYDMRQSHWLTAHGIRVWYPWPSLVDHRDSPSLIEGRNGRRHALRFLGEDRSALEHRWDGSRVEIAWKRKVPA